VQIYSALITTIIDLIHLVYKYFYENYPLYSHILRIELENLSEVHIIGLRVFDLR